MRILNILGKDVPIKDYWCSDGTAYYPRTDGKLWLYVNITDVCCGSCPFCINPGRRSGSSPFDIGRFRTCLGLIRDHVYGVSLTGGEPMLEPELVDAVLGAVREVFGREEIDLVTNGTAFDRLLRLENLVSLHSVHVSRHRLSDEDNDALFGFHTLTWEELRQAAERLDDPGALVLNCLLMKGGIETLDQAADYLERASSAGVRMVSFIGMSRCNPFCEEHYLDPFRLAFGEDRRFHIWSRYADHEFCGCMSGSYRAEAGSIRFYVRGMGSRPTPCARQLVYTEDNRLLAGFGGEPIAVFGSR
ncbi:MAG: radical SAM protein [Oscillospiraceae bacterium]|nr:radical SAM protein [Oscillospiraceae bacterium]